MVARVSLYHLSKPSKLVMELNLPNKAWAHGDTLGRWAPGKLGNLLGGYGDLVKKPWVAFKRKTFFFGRGS